MLNRRKFFFSFVGVMGFAMAEKVIASSLFESIDDDANTLHLDYHFSKTVSLNDFYLLAKNWHNPDYATFLKKKYTALGELKNESLHFNPGSFSTFLKFKSNTSLMNFLKEYNQNDPRDKNKVKSYGVIFKARLSRT